MNSYGLKCIKNWRNATVVDLETDGFLDVLTKAHVLSYTMNDSGNRPFNPKSIKGGDLKRIDAFIRHHIDNEIPIAGHNFIQFDLVALEKITGNDYSALMVIDTMALSWVLNTKRMRHGLDHFFEEYGVAKPEVTDWEGLTYEQYKHRCEEDIHINYLMWEDFKERLIDMYTNVKHNVDNVGVGGSRVSPDEVIYLDGKIGQSVDEWINQYLTFLMFKIDCAALKEKTMWEVDVENLDKAILEFEGMVEKIKTEVEGVMPKVPKYSVRKEPKVLVKKDGSPTVQAIKWQVLRDKFNNKETDEIGNPLVLFEVDETTGLGVVKELTKVEEPNLDSHVQVKDFLFKNGWIPCTFDSKRDDVAFEQWIQNKPQEGAHHGEWSQWKADKPEDRLIPKITVAGDDGKELSDSVQELAVEIPEVELYANYSTITHRLSVLNGFKNNLIDGKWLKAGVGGFTNTLRQKHRNLVNLPQASRPYAQSIRSNLISGKGKVLAGSDLSSLEDRTKNHFMLPLDPDYVEQMSSEGYDPHLSTAVYSGMITKEQMQAYKDKTLTGDELVLVTAARSSGKTTNYASVYGAGAATIAKGAGVSLAEGKKLHEGYWALNWSVLAIAKEQIVFKCKKGLNWLINPINGFCYSVRTEKDIFSTLAQGTGSFIFDMWVLNMLSRLKEDFGVMTLTADFHDEIIFCLRDNEKSKEYFTKVIEDGIIKVNKDFKLRVDMGCEVQFGNRYSEIH